MLMLHKWLLGPRCALYAHLILLALTHVSILSLAHSVGIYTLLGAVSGRPCSERVTLFSSPSCFAESIWDRRPFYISCWWDSLWEKPLQAIQTFMYMARAMLQMANHSLLALIALVHSVLLTDILGLPNLSLTWKKDIWRLNWLTLIAVRLLRHCIDLHHDCVLSFVVRTLLALAHIQVATCDTVCRLLSLLGILLNGLVSEWDRVWSLRDYTAWLTFTGHFGHWLVKVQG